MWRDRHEAVCRVPHPARVEVEEDQAAIRLAVRVAAVEVAVAGLPPQVAGHRLDPTAQQRDQRAQVAVVVRSIAQERLERGERTVKQVDEVEREARLVAREVVAGVVEPRRRLAVGRPRGG